MSGPDSQRRLSARRAVVLVLLLEIGAITETGCSRAYYRKTADSDVCGILVEKSRDPRWAAAGLDIQPDSRSRFFDATDPDNPPLPPDDPAVRPYMDCVYGLRGSKRWQRLDDVDFLENPAWPSFLQVGEQDGSNAELRIKNLTLTDAIEFSGSSNCGTGRLRSERSNTCIRNCEPVEPANLTSLKSTAV